MDNYEVNVLTRKGGWKKLPQEIVTSEDISKINSGFMRMTKGEKASFMKMLIEETKKELEAQGLTTNLKELT